MARSIRRLFPILIAGTILGWVGSMLYAVQLKARVRSTGTAGSDEIGLAAVFESLAFASTAARFRGGSVLCYYGGGVLDLRNATLDPAGAHLAVRTIFGGAQLLVPESWRVVSRVVGIFGGVGDTRRANAPGPDAPVLTLDGLALFGGLSISSEASPGTYQWVAKEQARRARA